MFRSGSQKKSHVKQQGSMLVIAVFILVVMGLLVLRLSRLLSGSSEAVAIEVLGTRAFFAAQSGMEIGLQQLFPLGASADCSAVTTELSFSSDSPDMNGLIGCSVSLSCTSSTSSENPAVTHYLLETAGQCNSGDTQTSRTLKMEVWN